MLAKGQTAVPASRRSLLSDDLTESYWSCIHVDADAVNIGWHSPLQIEDQSGSGEPSDMRGHRCGS